MAGPILDKAVARPTGGGAFQGVAPAPTMEMDGLMRGLSQFNPELGRYTDASIREEQQRADELLAAVSGQRSEQWDPAKRSMAEVLADDLPTGLPAAYGEKYRQTLGGLLVDRQAIKTKSDIAAAYQEASKAPDFNVDQFITEQRAKALNGLSNPALIGRLGSHLHGLELSIRSEAERGRLKRLDEATESGLFTAFQENLRADMTPEQIASQYSRYAQEWQKLGKTPKELAGMLFDRVQHLSEQKGGDPALFDVFNGTDPWTKQPLLAMNPQLADNVSRAREAARAKSQRLMGEAVQQENARKRMALDEMMQRDPSSITQEVVLSQMGPLGLFRTDNEAASYYAQARRMAVERQGDAAVMQAFDSGTLGRFKPEDQKKALEARLGPAIGAAWKAATAGDAGAMQGLAVLVMSEQNRARSTVPVEALERLVSTTVTTTQSTEGPSPAFQALASLHKGLSADPQFRSMYFKDDAAQILDTYQESLNAGSDPVAAYKAAYQAVSPESKEAARKLSQSHEFAKRIKSVTERVSGVDFFDRWNPWGATPKNGTMVQAAAAQAARDFMSRSPWASEKQAVEHASSHIKANFVFDRTSESAVQVPPGSADDTTSAAITEYTKRLAEAHRIKARNDGEWSVQLMPVGDGSLQHVVLVNGAASQNLGTIPLASVRQAYLAELSTTPQERDILLEVQKQLRTGALDLNYVERNSAVLAKVTKLDVLPRDTLKAIDEARLKQARAMVDSVPKLALGVPTMENLSSVPSRGHKVDNKLTAELASKALGQPGHAGLAASLITMGEAVVLKATPDPAKDAGNNIGMGYNLKANAKTVRADLAKAGVSDDRVEAVINGQAQITPVQAQRLLAVTVGRYEKQAQEAAEQTAPGLWIRMTPAQKAVMVDISWQTGDPAQFRKAWSALAAGDAEAFKRESKVFYVNSRGDRVEDKRRGELRAAMLAGDGPWVAAVNRFGSFPSTLLDAQAMNQAAK
jgi:hypothetical protein